MASVISVENFRELIKRHSLTVFRFFDGEMLNSGVNSATELIAMTDASQNLDFYSVNLRSYPDIGLSVDVDAPMLVIFRDGQEVTRYLGGHFDQIEYVLSRVMSGLMGPKGELSVQT